MERIKNQNYNGLLHITTNQLQLKKINDSDLIKVRGFPLKHKALQSRNSEDAFLQSTAEEIKSGWIQRAKQHLQCLHCSEPCFCSKFKV